MTIPHRKKKKIFIIIKIEHAISPYVAFGIMPLFAFANAGVSLDGLSFSSLLDKVPLGIVLGLFLGKQLGVFVFSYISIKLKLLKCQIIQIGLILRRRCSNRYWFYNEFICRKFSFCRKYAVHGWCK